MIWYFMAVAEGYQAAAIAHVESGPCGWADDPASAVASTHSRSLLAIAGIRPELRFACRVAPTPVREAGAQL
jgi:hypothetical protein